jgi:hypothetical protein
MMVPMHYRLVQFVPSDLDVLRVTVGVYVYSDSERWLTLHSSEDIRRRTRSLVNSAPGAHDHVLASLSAYARRLQVRGDQAVLPIERDVDMPELLLNPERYNNRIQLSEPFGFVGEDTRSAADFLLKSLAPLPPRPGRARGSADVRRDLSALIRTRPLLDHFCAEGVTIQRPHGVDSVAFSFTSQRATVLADTVSLEGNELDRVRASARSFAYSVQSIRRSGAVLMRSRGEAPVGVRADVPIEVVYAEPTTDNGRELLHELEQDWADVGVVSFPESRVDAALDRVEQSVVSPGLTV